MAHYVALLRGINVGGTGLLAMKELTDICSRLGFRAVRTYIQSGNVLLTSESSEDTVRAPLEKALAAKMGKKIDVMVRTAEEIRSVLRRNPFPDRDGARVAVGFLHESPPETLMRDVIAPGGEEVRRGKREIYIYYPEGMGRSKLKLPLNGAAVTVRNMKTVAKLAAMTEM